MQPDDDSMTDWRSGRGSIPVPSQTLADPVPAELAELQSAASLAGLIERRVRTHPDRTALQTPDRDWTYREVNESANAVAHSLLAIEPDRKERIMLWLDEPRAVACAVLASLKAGWCFFARQPQAPEAYNQALVERVKPRVILTSRPQSKVVADLADDDVEVLAVDELLNRPQSENPQVTTTGHTVLRLVFTSGSTGNPKGVVHDQQCMLHEAFSAIAGAHYSAEERLLQMSSMAHVNGSDWLIYMLVLGGTLSCFPLRELGLEKLADWVARKRITRFVAVPSVYRRFLEQAGLQPDHLSSVRVVHLGGEPVRPEDVREFRKWFPADAKLIGNIGSTEGGSFARRVFSADSELPQQKVALGRPHPGLQIELWDEVGRPVGPGGWGEIVIRSRGVAQGYLDDPEATLAQFAVESANEGWRRFRTGDLAEWGDDGQLYSRGRIDHQVQINGQRVEPLELEMMAAEHPELVGVAVKAWPDPATGMRLTLYFVRRGGSELSSEGLRLWLHDRLPAPLLPRYTVPVAALPFLESGKLNRDALADLSEGGEATGGLPLENDELERQLCGLFGRVFGRDAVRGKDNFFELGGDSLRATELAVGIESELGWSLPFNALFEAPTPRSLAQLLRSAPEGFENIVSLATGRGEAVLVVMHGWGGTIGPWRPLIANLDLDTLVVGVQGNEHAGNQFRPESIDELADHYAAILRTRFSDRPLILAGFSAGGVLAWIVAERLVSWGYPVRGLLMVDSRPNGIPKPMRGIMMGPYLASRLGHHALDFLKRGGNRIGRLKERRAAAAHLAGVVAEPVKAGADPYADLLRAHRLPRLRLPVGLIQCRGTREKLDWGWKYLGASAVRRWEAAVSHYEVLAESEVDQTARLCAEAWEWLSSQRR